MVRAVTAAAALLVSALVPIIEANAADIKILSPGATEGVLNELLPQFDKATTGPPAISPTACARARRSTS
jgi:hypothetical protein